MEVTRFGALNTPTDLSLFNLENIKFNAPGFWASANVPTSSRNSSIQQSDDEEEHAVQSSEDFLRCFHSNRQLILKNLPKNTSEKDVSECVTALKLQPVRIQLHPADGAVTTTNTTTTTNNGTTNSATDSAASATVHVQWPHLLDTLPVDTASGGGGGGGGSAGAGVSRAGEKPVTIHGQPIQLSLSPTTDLLCVARLPATCCDRQLLQLARQHGAVSYAHVLRSPNSGLSRGYGFVMYQSRQLAARAKSLLDGARLATADGGAVIACDWVLPTRTTLRSLYSKCLHVENLPEGYRNMREFREVFSCITNPPYCQIGLKNGSPQDWGLVEYGDWQHADRTYDRLQAHALHGRRLRLSFCMPAVRAIDICLRVSEQAAAARRSAGALLPEPSAPALLHSLHTLHNQHPGFATSLGTIIAGNLAELQQQQQQDQQQQQQQQQAALLASLSQPHFLPAVPMGPYLAPSALDPALLTAAAAPPPPPPPAAAAAAPLPPDYSHLLTALALNPSLFSCSVPLMLPVAPSIPMMTTVGLVAPPPPPVPVSHHHYTGLGAGPIKRKLYTDSDAPTPAQHDTLAALAPHFAPLTHFHVPPTKRPHL